MLKSVGAVLAGIVVSQLVILLTEYLGSVLFPPPAGVDLTNPAAMRAFVEQLPAMALVLVLAGWAVGSFIGGWLTARLAPGAPIVHALIVGCLGTAAAVVNVMTIPHPAWFSVLGPLLFIPAALLGASMGRRRTAASAPAPVASRS
jgi:hypothetical protein